MPESELAAMFARVALVDEVTVIRDRATRVSRGNGSVRLPPPLPPTPGFPIRAPRQCGSRARRLRSGRELGRGSLRRMGGTVQRRFAAPSFVRHLFFFLGGWFRCSRLALGWILSLVRGNAAAELHLPSCSWMLGRGRKVSCFAGIGCLAACFCAMQWGISRFRGILVPFMLNSCYFLFSGGAGGMLRRDTTWSRKTALLNFVKF